MKLSVISGTIIDNNLLHNMNDDDTNSEENCLDDVNPVVGLMQSVGKDFLKMFQNDLLLR